MKDLDFTWGDLDIKILILFILDKLPQPVTGMALADLVLFDGGFTWFDYTDCLAELVKTEHVLEDNGWYIITEKGRKNVHTVASSIPEKIRAKAEQLAASTAAGMRRSEMIETSVEPGANDGAVVCLRLSDGAGEIASIRLAVPNEAKASAIEKRFRFHAESICQKLIELLTE